MSLFAKRAPTNAPIHIQQLKTWVAAALALEDSALVSISQLRCHQPGCSPVETVIAVMTTPPQTYKIHKAAADIIDADVANALSVKANS